jgi:hypothetical protein
VAFLRFHVMHILRVKVYPYTAHILEPIQQPRFPAIRELCEVHWSTKFNFFFVPRGKISNPDRTFNAEFKYVSSFSPSPTVFL